MLVTMQEIDQCVTETKQKPDYTLFGPTGILSCNTSREASFRRQQTEVVRILEIQPVEKLAHLMLLELAIQPWRECFTWQTDPMHSAKKKKETNRKVTSAARKSNTGNTWSSPLQGKCSALAPFSLITGMESVIREN